MKKFILSTALFILLAAMFVSCASTSGSGEPKYPEFEIVENEYRSPNKPFPFWDNQDIDGNYVYYTYGIKSTPEKYKAYKGNLVFYIMDGVNHGDMWNKPNKEKILAALKKGKIQEFEMNGKMYLAVTTVKNN